MKLSNKFTLTRIILALVFLLLYFLPVCMQNELFVKISGWILIPLLAFTEFTDFLDGFSARKRNEVSDFGKIFDPFADVFLHITTLCAFTFDGYFNVICLILILYREFTMNFLRMVASKKGVAIAARKGGKLKTCLYILTGFVILLKVCALRTGCPVSDTFSRIHAGTVSILQWVCVVAAYISFVDYIKNFGSLLKSEM